MGPILDLSTLFPWRILMLFAYSFAYYNIAHALLKDKYHPAITFGSIFVLRILLSCLSNWCDVGFNASFLFFFLFLVLAFVLTLFLTEGKTLKKVTVTIFYLIFYLFTAFASSVYTNLAFHGTDYYELYHIQYPDEDLPQIFFGNIVLILSVSFLFAGILKLFESRKPNYTHKKLYAYFSFLPLTHIFFVIVSLIAIPLGNEAVYTHRMLFFIYATLFGILLFDCSFPFVVDHFEKIEMQNNKRKKELIEATMNYQQTLILKQERQEVRKIKHDILNLTATAKQFIENGTPEKALEILDQTHSDMSAFASFHMSTNDTINTILYMKQKQAQDSSVTLMIDVTETAPILIDDYSVCRVLHNMLDNAIEAAAETTEKTVHVQLKVNTGIFIFSCENTFVRLPSEHRAGRGYGTGIVKEIAQQHNGTYATEITAGVFHATLKMQNQSIDEH